MISKWRANRNMASAALVKSELSVYLNFGMKCKEFYSYTLSDSKLLSATASCLKYYWHNMATTACASAPATTDTHQQLPAVLSQ